MGAGAHPGNGYEAPAGMPPRGYYPNVGSDTGRPCDGPVDEIIRLLAHPDLDPGRGSFTVALATARDQLTAAAGIITDTTIDHPPRRAAFYQPAPSPGVARGVTGHRWGR